MNNNFCSVPSRHPIPDFGDVRISYTRQGNNQLIYVDGIPVYIRAIGQRQPFGKQTLYQAYRQSLFDLPEHGMAPTTSSYMAETTFQLGIQRSNSCFLRTGANSQTNPGPSQPIEIKVPCGSIG